MTPVSAPGNTDLASICVLLSTWSVCRLIVNSWCKKWSMTVDSFSKVAFFLFPISPLNHDPLTSSFKHFFFKNHHSNFTIISYTHLPQPATMVKNLVLHKHFGQPVVVPNDAFGIWCFQNCALLLEDLNGLTDAPIELAGPSNLPRHRRQVPSDDGFQAIVAIHLGHHVQVSAVKLQDELVLLLNGHVGQPQFLKTMQEPQSTIGAGHRLKLLVHEGHNGILKREREAMSCH